MKMILQSLRLLMALTLLTGILYPVLVTGLAQAFFPHKANGSLIRESGRIVGSELLAQKFEDPKYFRPRPSAVDYATVASGASNKGPTSMDLVKAINERRQKFGEGVPEEMLTASASGLDPHISPSTAEYQIPGIAAARNLSEEKIRVLVREKTEKPQMGVFGETRINVLSLNLALDRLN